MTFFLRVRDRAKSNHAVESDAPYTRNERAYFETDKWKITMAQIESPYFGYRAVRDMRVRGKSYEDIKAAWRSICAPGTPLPNVLKVSCSMLQRAEELGLKISSDTTRAECAAKIREAS